MCAEELLPYDSPLNIQGAHSLVWLSHVDLSAVLIISGKQPPSGLMQLRGIYLCILAKLNATVVLRSIFSTSRNHLVFPRYPLAPCHHLD